MSGGQGVLSHLVSLETENNPGWTFVRPGLFGCWVRRLTLSSVCLIPSPSIDECSGVPPRRVILAEQSRSVARLARRDP